MDVLLFVSGASYIGIFLAVLLLGYLAPVPEEVLLPTIGYLAYLGVFRFEYALVAALAGAALSDNILFWISKKKGEKFVDHFVKRFNISEWQIERAKKYIHRNAALSLSLLRAIPGIKLLGPILAGLSKMRWRHFQLFDIIGATAWVATLMAAGFYFGGSVHGFFREAEHAAPAAVIAAIIAAALYVFRKKKEITKSVFRSKHNGSSP